MIGVDFGGTLIKAGIVENGEVLRSKTTPTPIGSSPDRVLDTIAATVRALDATPTSVGVAIPGEVDGEGKCWGLPNVPGFKGVLFGEGLSSRLGCPVAVENDATTAALGERLYGHGRRHPSFLMMTLGTGIGGGLVIGHQLYPGSYGFAGEIGHFNIDSAADAWACACGMRGCVEAYAGTRGLMRTFAEHGRTASEVLEIAESARAGEEAGLRTFERMGLAVGKALANIQNVLDLSAIVFTGGVAQSFDLIESHVRLALRRHCFARPPAEVPLLVSELGARAGVIGAAHLTTL
jgi:glucokinase